MNSADRPSIVPPCCPRCFCDLRPRGQRKQCDFCGYLTPLPEPATSSTPPGIELLAGLDLGQLQDYTALAIGRRVPTPEGNRYDVTALHRFELGTGYPAMVRKVSEWLNQPELSRTRLVVDQTGVGVAVVDMFREAAGLGNRLVPVSITAGRKAILQPDGSWHVAKVELVSALQAALSGRRLNIARGLPEAATVVKELKGFRAKVTAAGNETFEAWRERDHDDLVLALALLVWYGENQTTAQAVNLVPARPL